MGKEGFCKRAICCVPRMCITKPNIPAAASFAITWNTLVLGIGVINVIFDQTDDVFDDAEAWRSGIGQICIAGVGLIGGLVARCCDGRVALLLALVCSCAAFAGYGIWAALTIVWTIEDVDDIEWYWSLLNFLAAFFMAVAFINHGVLSYLLAADVFCPKEFHARGSSGRGPSNV
mmetsp:Transcript_20726/g.66736  ORF Transcript_20726/g.66736 Transcript_20726/m.66736 type:complete len:175 (-) Transcript_20726:149-673(-)